MSDEFDWFAGIDWAAESYQICLVDASGTIVGEKNFAHSGSGLAALADWLAETSGGPAEAIAVAIEKPHGAVIDILLERGFAVYALNPKQLDRFRDRFTVAGAKDDRRDAHVLGDGLRSDRHCYRRLFPEASSVIELREWSRMAGELGQERTRLANRMREQLRRYFPDMLDITDDIATDWFLELWKLAPTPDQARRVQRAPIARLLKTRRVRRIDADGVRAILRRQPLVVAAGTVEAATAHIRITVERLQLINRQIREANTRIDRLCNRTEDPAEETAGQRPEQRDVKILRSLPGLGRIVLATLLAEAPRLLRDRDYHALRSLCGVAPVTRQSGKTRHVVRRMACHARLREATYHWARVAIQHDAHSRQHYAALRAKGHSHGRALRSVADKLLAVACAMLKSKTLFDPDRRTPYPNAA